MNRYTDFDGIILKNSRIGDYHKGVKIFSPDDGITDAIAYGGYKPKSKLGSLVSPMVCGHFVLYHSPSSKKPKIDDFSPESCFLKIQVNLEKYYIVLTWFEIVIKSHGGGDSSAGIYSLLVDCMRKLDECPDGLCAGINVHFLNSTLNLMGFYPDNYFQKPDSMLEYQEQLLSLVQRVLECKLNTLSGAYEIQ